MRSSVICTLHQILLGLSDHGDSTILRDLNKSHHLAILDMKPIKPLLKLG
jgi:hypothetical protein